MKKAFSLLLVLVVVLGMLVGCGSNSTSSSGAASSAAAAKTENPDYTLKLSLIQNEGDSNYNCVKLFADKVYEKTNGAVKVDLYPGSTLGDGAASLEGLPLGICDIWFGAICNLASYTELANIDGAPFIYSSNEHYNTVWTSDLADEIRTSIGDASDKVLLGYGCSGVRIMTTNKPIHSIDDIKGLRLRVPTIDVYIKTWEWLKATPTPLGGSEIFTAIQQGTVDGQENSYIDSLNLGLHEVCKYATESNHAYITNCFIFDKKFFNSLPESCQQAMREAANEASEYKNRVLVDETAAAKQKFIEAGIEIIEVNTDEFMSYFNGFMEKHYPSLSKWREEILAMDPKGV